MKALSPAARAVMQQTIAASNLIRQLGLAEAARADGIELGELAFDQRTMSWVVPPAVPEPPAAPAS